MAVVSYNLYSFYYKITKNHNEEREIYFQNNFLFHLLFYSEYFNLNTPSYVIFSKCAVIPMNKL